MSLSERVVHARARRWLRELCRNLAGRGIEYARLVLGEPGLDWHADWNSADTPPLAALQAFAAELHGGEQARNQLLQGSDNALRLLIGIPLARTAQHRATCVLVFPAAVQGEAGVITGYVQSAFSWLLAWLAEVPEELLANTLREHLTELLQPAPDAASVRAALATLAQHYRQAHACLVWVRADGLLGFAASDEHSLPLWRDSLRLCWESLSPGWPAQAVACWPPPQAQTQASQGLQQIAQQAAQAAATAFALCRGGRPLAMLLCMGERPIPYVSRIEWALAMLALALQAGAAPVPVAPLAARRRRIAVGLALTAALLALLWPWPQRIHEMGRLAGSSERTVVSTQAGYLSEVRVRPGDPVKAGDLVLRLEDQALREELARWEGEVARQESRYLQAMSQRAVAEAAAVQGELQEARAEAALARLRVQQASLRAPIEGVVVSGDLDRAIGTAVSEGEALLRIAPAGRYRVLFDVDEDLAHLLQPGQAGELSPNATPGRHYAVRLTRVAPLARVVEGRNRVEVEAELAQPAPELKPGQGVAISLGLARRSGLWLLWDAARRNAARWWWRLGVAG